MTDNKAFPDGPVSERECVVAFDKDGNVTALSFPEWNATWPWPPDDFLERYRNQGAVRATMARLVYPEAS